MTRRFALYFAPPPGSELESFGRNWLGRDHINGRSIEQEVIGGLSADDQQRITSSARHYGFHATLKAPFALKQGGNADALHEAADNFTQQRKTFEAPPLRISGLSRWVAFTLSGPSLDMDRLAADCVRDFEPFRAPMTDHDLERRRQNGLTPRQDDQLQAFGYPYIFDDFHFHMTLAGPLDSPEKDMIVDLLQKRAASIEAPPLIVDAIAIYEQPDRDQSFTQTARFPFRA